MSSHKRTLVLEGSPISALHLVNYLMSIVRMDIRRKERGLAKFAPREGQDPAEAETARKHLEEALAFRRQAYEELRKL